MSNVINTNEVTGDTLVTDLYEAAVGQTIHGPFITIEPSSVPGLRVDNGSGRQVNQKDRLSGPQLGVFVRWCYDHGHQGTLAEAVPAFRAEFLTSPNQGLSIGVDKIMQKLAEARFGDPLTEKQQQTADRLVDQLSNGVSMGKGQEHLDAKVAELRGRSPRIVDALILRFLEMENQGDYDKALNNYRRVVGDFNRRREASGPATFGTVTDEVAVASTDAYNAAFGQSVSVEDDTEVDAEEVTPAETF